MNGDTNKSKAKSNKKDAVMKTTVKYIVLKAWTINLVHHYLKMKLMPMHNILTKFQALLNIKTCALKW